MLVFGHVKVVANFKAERSWVFSAIDTQPAVDRDVSHAFADNGTDSVVLTVTDRD
jgi:hypothetical protein